MHTPAAIEKHIRTNIRTVGRLNQRFDWGFTKEQLREAWNIGKHVAKGIASLDKLMLMPYPRWGAEHNKLVRDLTEAGGIHFPDRPVKFTSVYGDYQPGLHWIIYDDAGCHFGETCEFAVRRSALVDPRQLAGLETLMRSISIGRILHQSSAGRSSWPMLAGLRLLMISGELYTAVLHYSEQEKRAVLALTSPQARLFDTSCAEVHTVAIIEV